MVLLVVIAMLALFATVALSFVFYAEAEATASRYASQAQTQAQADVDPELLLSYFLSQLIYDTDNVNSAMRGHSLARTMYGGNPNQFNVTPFSGTGRARYNVPTLNVNNANAVNFQYYPTDGFIRHPEVVDSTFLLTNTHSALAGNKYISCNVPWTYPDTNNMFLAAVDANGNVLIPSFVRSWAASPSASTLAQKYTTLRPHSSYHSAFAPPEYDGTCDVKNLDNSPGRSGGGMNDSIWMDLGFPVMTAPNGKKYKALFAPLVVDLDNRLNLSMHGNIKGPGQTHASHQGWGPWEVNLTSTLPNFKNLLTNSTAAYLPRYGTAATPTGSSPSLPTGLSSAPWYANVDLDSLGATGPMALPTGSVFSMLPTFPGTWYSTTELTGYPGSYRYFSPSTGNNPPLALSNQEAIMRFGGTGSPALTSTLLQSLATDLQNLQARNRVTLLSMDVDRPGFNPFLWESATSATANAGHSSYQYSTTTGYATMTNAVKTPATPTQAGLTADFSADWRSTIAALTRVDLTKNSTGSFLTPYSTSATQADADRTALARSLYNMLIKLTGCKDPNTTAVANTSADYQAARFLAQVAVNIVDYVDEDDVITQFNWFTGETVYGTELPRLVINEVYCQIDNDPTDPGIDPTTKPVVTDRSATKYNLNFWVELHNTMATSPGAAYPGNPGNITLANGAGAVYRLLITKRNTTLADDHPENVKGDPDAANNPPISTVDDFPTTGNGSFVAPHPTSPYYKDSTKTNQGFYVVGPSSTATDFLAAPPHPSTRSPGLTVPYPSAKMKTTYTVPPAGGGAAPIPAAPYDILLQRLANPNANPNPSTNPYVTVDYVQNITASDNRVYNPTTAGITPPAITSLASKGRKQPYSSVWVDQNPTPGAANRIKSTFFRHNGQTSTPPPSTSDNTLDRPFDWLVHLNRPVINGLELLHVSGYAPHRLTQKFIPATGAKFGHRNLWEDQNSLVYRLLEMIKPTEYQDVTGQTFARIPGKININTIWDQQIWQALCDRQAMNGFQATDVTSTFSNLLMGTATARTRSGVPGATDIPFTSLGTGPLPATGDTNFPTGLGMNISSILRGNNPTSPTLPTRTGWVAGASHPYLKYELLSKIYNNVTTRSNCFAVWLTAGFFEVDDSVVPAKIMGEIGRTENRHIRHRMFAMVDRTNLLLPPLPSPAAPTYSTSLSAATPNATNPKQFTLAQTKWPLTIAGANINLCIRPGMKFTIGTQTVEVDTVDHNTRTVIAKSNLTGHASGTAVNLPGTLTLSSTISGTNTAIPGNPGPQEGGFDIRQNTLVVPYFSIIQ